MGLEFDDSHGEIQATDIEYPGIVGRGRTERGAEADWNNRVRTTWHHRRIANCQAVVDLILGHAGEPEMPTLEQITELQLMVDEFVGYLRQDKLIPPLDTSV